MVIVYFNQRRASGKESSPPFQGLFLVVAVGRAVFTPQPERESEPNNNTDWIGVKIAAIAHRSYYAVGAAFATGWVVHKVKCSESAGKYATHQGYGVAAHGLKYCLLCSQRRRSTKVQRHKYTNK